MLVYLLIGTDADPCIAQVARLLMAQGEEVLVTPEPFTDGARLRWHLETDSSSSVLSLDRSSLPDTGLGGVLVRAAGPWDAAGWSAKDFAYVQAETQAALLGWLGSLACPVLNPARAEVWFKARRSLPEQRVLLARSSLRTRPVLVTNDPLEARRFAEGCGGVLRYVPITSSLAYPIDDAAQWVELERLMGRLPVCLLEPAGMSVWGSYAAGETVWSAPLSSGERRRFEAGVARLARMLGVHLLQLELHRVEGELCAHGFTLHPDFSRHDASGQEELAAGVAAGLRGLAA